MRCINFLAISHEDSHSQNCKTGSVNFRAQTPHPPTHLFFFCEIPPAVGCGGETPILPSAEVCRIMCEKHESFMRKIEEKGVRYVRIMPAEDDPTSAIGRGWKSTFNCNTKGFVFAYVRNIERLFITWADLRYAFF